MLTMLREDFRKSVIQWLAPYSPTALHRAALASDQAGTGRWFLDGPFHDWVSSESSEQVLTLRGKRSWSLLQQLLPTADLYCSWHWQDYANVRPQSKINQFQTDCKNTGLLQSMRLSCVIPMNFTRLQHIFTVLLPICPHRSP